MLPSFRFRARPGLPRAGVLICGAIIGGRIAVALFGSLFPLPDPNSFASDNGFLPPALGMWLGTDYLGRDMLSRLVDATRTTLFMSLAAMLFAHVLGEALGILAALRRG